MPMGKNYSVTSRPKESMERSCGGEGEGIGEQRQEAKMLVTFRIKDRETTLHSKPASITALELAALVRKLHGEHGTIDADMGEFGYAPLNFEINANSLSIAAFSACFGYRADVIAVLDEAQFLGRMIRIEHRQRDEPITIRVSSNISLARELMMSEELAKKMLFALGLSDDASGSMTLGDAQEALRSPRTYDAFVRARIEPLFDSLSLIAFTNCGDQLPVLEWSQ